MQLETPILPIDQWALDPEVVHLNHGSYGGCPREVIDAANALRNRLEAAPMRFLVGEWQPALDRARHALARFLHCDDARLVFVPNATTAVAIALAAQPLAPGDRILTTDHGYRACRNQLDRFAHARDAVIDVVAVHLPFDPAQLIADVTAAITPRTRLALFDHVTSATALRMPIEAIVPILRARGVAVIVDGAHAPGQIPLAVDALGATCYAGNCHKWLCAPKGSGFLVVDPAIAPAIRPLVTSHGASADYGPANRLHAELDWAGTHDPTPHLAVPIALDAISRAAGGWPAAIAHNHALALALRDRLIAGLGGRTARRQPDDTVGTMACIPIALPPNTTEGALQKRLLDDGWEVPIVAWPTGPLVRVSAHLYNHVAQADALAAKLRALGVTLAA
jgi:isopenicillin-N epimerase